mgnify:CR=1 FL=1|jgi:hypothetical protein
MLPSFFQQPLRFIAWCTGVDLVPTPPSTTGFSIDDLAQRRAPLLFERALKAACSLLLLIVSVLYVFRWGSWLLNADSYWCALPTAVWILFMLLRYWTPMDAESIGVGLWTLSPAVAIASDLGVGFVRLDLIPLQSLLWQAGAVVAMIAFGLIRDLLREMNAKN